MSEPTDSTKDRLKSFIERIERLEEEKRGTSEHIRYIYSEAKANDNHLHCYTFETRKALNSQGYEYCNSACGNSGYLCTGDNAAVPAYYLVTSGVFNEASSRWDKIDQGTSLLDTSGQISAFGATGTPPAAIFINYGTNEYLQTKSTANLQAAVTGCLSALRGPHHKRGSFPSSRSGCRTLRSIPTPPMSQQSAQA